MPLVSPTYLVDSTGQQWLVAVSNAPAPMWTLTKVSGKTAFSAFYLNDIATSQIWKVTAIPASGGNGDLVWSLVSGPPSPTQLLVNSPDGTLWAIQFQNGVIEVVSGTTCVYPFSSLRSELAQRLNDPQKVFWTDAELKVHIWNALRFWNVLTGDNKIRYQLTTNPTNVWYDMLQLAGSPRVANLYDADVYSWLQYALLEAQQPNAAMSSGQYSTDDVIQAVQRKRDEFLFRSGCTTTVETLNVTPNTTLIALPSTVIQTRRAYWLPADPTTGPAYPLIKADDWVTTAYVSDMTAAPPDTFSAGMEMANQMLLAPPPNVEGTVECLTIESQELLGATYSTLLVIPPDFVPALLWGALADLLDSAMEKTDKPRADYARMRYEQFAELMAHYPFVFSMKVNGNLRYADAVEVLDLYDSNWRTVAANPSVLGLSGQNLIAFPSATSMNVEVFMLASANLPVNDGDCVLLSREIMDAVLDMAQHEASWKMGGAEFQSTMSLFQNIIKVASKRNAKILAMATFKEVLYGREDREDEITPKETVSEK